MDLEEIKTVSEIIQSWCSTAAVLLGGGWVLWRFVLQREAHPKIEFAIELQVLGRVHDEWLINVIAVVTNRGTVRHYLCDFWFNLHPLSMNDQIEIGGSEIDGQVRFGRAARRRDWIAAGRTDFVIDPGVTLRDIHVTTVPLKTAFALVYGHFRYPGSGGTYHSAQQAFALSGPAAPNGKAIRSTASRLDPRPFGQE